MADRFEVASRSELMESGMTRWEITEAVRSGRLIRARRDRYLEAEAPDDLVRAVRVGGRLACVSFLAMLGVFVHTNAALHVHMTRGSARMRTPHSRRVRLGPPFRVKDEVRLHWRSLREAVPDCAGAVDVLDALVDAVRCQSPRNAIATLDSALNRGLITAFDLSEIFAGLPLRFSVLLPLIDGRAGSGPETLIRLMARSLGCRVDLQVAFEGVGFVDLLIDDWLVIECDSERFHATWNQQKKDRERDAALAARGFVTLRLTAEMIMYRPETAHAALRGLLAAPPRPSC